MPHTSSPITPRILVIERDIEIQKRIAHSLHGVFTMDLTSSGSLALLLMKDYHYSCIVASTELPNRHHGVGILRAIRSMPGGRYVPIIAAVRDESIARRTAMDGFIASLTLPADIARIEAVVTRVLEVWD